jgi:hypothetical protein
MAGLGGVPDSQAYTTYPMKGRLERAEHYMLAPIGRRLHGATHPPESAPKSTTFVQFFSLMFRGVTNSMKAYPFLSSAGVQ